jgi:hypothetical protein
MCYRIPLLGADWQWFISQAVLFLNDIRANSGTYRPLAFGATQNTPRKGPGPYSIIDVVPAATGSNDWPVKSSKIFDDVRIDIISQIQMRQRIPCKPISAQLQNYHVGIESSD